MKKIFCLAAVLGLAACERPKYDFQMVCEDAAKGDLLVDAKIYKSHADLVVKRLDKELREKALNHGRGSMWLADHVWLYNQIPNIDDKIELSLPVTDHGDYEVPGKVKLAMSRGTFTGGLKFMLWHAADNNLTMNNGEKIPDGEYMRGTSCEPVLYPEAVEESGLSAEQKNCLNYVSSQIFMDNIATEKRLLVYDEKTGRTMYIGAAAINEIFGTLETYHFFFCNMNYYPDDAKRACDVAARLRKYIAEHIDAEYIPEPKNVVSVSAGGEITLSVGGEKIIVRGE